MATGGLKIIRAVIVDGDRDDARCGVHDAVFGTFATRHAWGGKYDVKRTVKLLVNI